MVDSSILSEYLEIIGQDVLNKNRYEIVDVN